MKPATLDRKVRDVEREGRAQARMWLRSSEMGDYSVQMAYVVLLSTVVRTDELRGTPSTLELLTGQQETEES